MSWWNRVGAWVGANLWRSRMESEMDAEMRFHVEARAEDLARGGMGRSAALRQARIEFGGLEQAKEECRDARGVRFLEGLEQDLRFCGRTLRNSAGFASVAVVTLALGIGATTALFSVMRAVLISPLPYRDAHRMAVLWTDNTRQGLHEERTSYPNFQDWRTENTTFEHLAFVSAFTVNLTAGDEPERVVAARTSVNLFSLMGAGPILGRTFTTEEENRGERVVVASQGLWRRRFGKAPTVEGKSLEVDGVKMAVVGVMPARFQFPDKNVELWMPLSVFPNWSKLKTERKVPSGFVLGRLKAGVSLAQAQADLNVIGARLAGQYPEIAADLDFFGFGVNVVPFDIYVTGKEVRLALWLLFVAVLLVLVVACANVAGLLLARGAARAGEFATRMALGAARTRLVRQLVTESGVLYVISGALGIALAVGAGRLLKHLAPSGIPRLEEAAIDRGVLSFALMLSLLAAVVFGFLPAMRVLKADPQLFLKESGRRISQASGVVQLRSLLVTGEFAMAVILVIGASLLLRSFLRAQGMDPGFQSDRVLTARVVQSKLKPEAQWAEFYREALVRIRATPGVQSAAAIDNLFFASFPDERIVVEGHPSVSPGDPLFQVTDDGVSPEFFEALGVPLLRGRWFSEADREGSPPCAVINATMSRRFWQGEDPIGKRFQFSYQEKDEPWITVVGVVGDMRRDGLTRDPVSQVFLPLSQHRARGMDLVVRTSGDPHHFTSVVRNAIWSVDRTAPVFNLVTLDEALRDQLAPMRFQTFLLSVFAFLTVVLAAVGVYGLMHYSVVQRTQEFGVRMALGATRPAVAALVAGHAAKWIGLGIGIGLAAAVLVSRTMASLLFGAGELDVVAFAGVSLLLASVGLVACWIPVWRATRVEPMEALRYE